jgi:hypothetical protein
MRDGDQGVDPGEEHGVHVHEVHGEDGLGLRGEELAPGWTRPARCRVEASVMEYLPHRGGSDAMAESDQFALHSPVPPGGILGCHADDKLLDRRRGRWTSGSAAYGVVPLARDQPCRCRKLRSRWSGYVVVFVEDAAESIMPLDVEVVESRAFGDWWW